MKLTTLLEKRSGSNVSEATVQLLKKLQIPVTAATAIEKVESHPDFPSLYSISDSLKSWKVENEAFHVEAENLGQLPTPFIAHTRRGGGNFVLVNNVNGLVDLINEKGKREKVGREEFLKDWTNTVLLAEKNELSGEKNYHKRRKEEVISGLRIPFLLGGGLLMIAIYIFWFINGVTGIIMSLLLIVKLLGSLVTGLLLWFEVDKANPLLQQICTGNKSNNCTTALSSNGSKLFHWLSWSEIGFFYFAGGLLYGLLTPGLQLSSLSILFWLNLIALPYVVFSIFYQWQVTRQWCPLCLAVQALLLTEFLICYFGYWTAASIPSIGLTANQLTYLFNAFLLPVVFWVASKKAYYAAQTGKQYKKELNKLKYNKEIFSALLEKQKRVAVSTNKLGIVLGNPDAKHTLIKVCNPYCGPCAKAHKVIDELIETGEVRVQIIFTVSNKENDRNAALVKHLMAIYENGNVALMHQALNAWYNSEEKDYEVFKTKFPLEDEEIRRQNIKLEEMKRWCDKTGISFTPTIFVNDYHLPDVYRLEELKHLL